MTMQPQNDTSKLSKEQKSIALNNDLQRREKELCEASFEQFVRSAWHILEPATPLLWNPHLSYLCEEVQDSLTRIGNHKRRKHHLCVNVPPSSLKTMIFTRMANAWAWIHWPWMRFITASHTQSLAEEHAMDTKMVIDSEWYQSFWGSNYRIVKTQNAKSFYRTTFRGQRQVTSVTSTTLGRHCHIFICDDLLDPKKAASEADLLAADLFWRRTAQSRFIDARIGTFWVIQQRLSERDTTGRILEREAKFYKHICLPGEERPWISPPELRETYVKVDPDRPALLFPTKFSWEVLDRLKGILDSVGYASQILQRPSPEEGEIFKRVAWRFWVPDGIYLPPVTMEIGGETFTCETIPLPASFDNIVCSWDFTFNDKVKSDYVSGHTIGQKAANYYFLDEFRKKIDFGGSKTALIAMKNKWPLASTIYVEAKANGEAIISEVRDWIEGITPVRADKGEDPYTRAIAVSPLQRSGNFILPHPHIAPWVMDFIEEYAAYNNGTHDDRVCSGCQAIFKMRRSRPVLPKFEPKLQSYKIGWRDLDKDSRLYISQYVDSDLHSSITMALWSTRTGRLLVFDEFIVSTTRPEEIKSMLEMKITRISGGIITKLDRFAWYGNAFMFGRARGSTASRSTLVVDGISESYIRCGINLQENLLYDEAGSILLLQRMAGSGSALLDQSASETIRQASAWQYEGNEAAPGNGCIRSVCNIVSVLYEAGKNNKKPEEIKSYSEQREKIYKELEKNNGNEYINQGRAAIPDNEKWMV